MPENITDQNFEEKVTTASADKPILVDFWAPWCGPCKILAPILEEVKKDLGSSAEIYKLDVDISPATAGKYAIRSIPTMIVFKGGVEVERVVGVLSREAITNLIKKHTV